MIDLRLHWMLKHIENGTYDIPDESGLTPRQEMEIYVARNKPFTDAFEAWSLPVLCVLGMNVLILSVVYLLSKRG